jgi:hypothetical protein
MCDGFSAHVNESREGKGSLVHDRRRKSPAGISRQVNETMWIKRSEDETMNG